MFPFTDCFACTVIARNLLVKVVLVFGTTH